MKVKRLKMTSFRGISDLMLEFHETEPTVFIGINGVGKSTILECLAILLFCFTEQIEIATLADQGFDKSKPSFSTLDITNGCNETHNEISVSLNDSRDLTWSFTKNRKANKRGICTDLAELQAVADDISAQLGDNSVNLPLAVYYTVNRAVLDIPLKRGKEYFVEQVVAYDQALLWGRADFRIFFEWFRYREDLENELRLDNSEYRDRHLEAVRQAISSLLPGFSDLRVRRSPLRMTVTKQGQELIINLLSDGEKCLLAMVGDLARRLAIANPSLPDPLQGSGVVLIDEIELHLHPKWQREIIPALTRTFPNCQFIVTTHSPQVISQVKPEGIYILERTDTGIVARRPESSYGRDSNRILEDLMGVPERPQKIKDRLLELFRLIDKGDLDAAKQLRQELEDEIGYDEPEFVSADVLMRRKEILKK